MIDSIIRLIGESNNIVILSHVAPDGDSIGSSLALYNALNKKGKNVEVIIDDEVPYVYRFLYGADRVKKVKDSHKEGKFDLAITLDSSDIDRLGKSAKYLINGKTINIDHHISNDGYGTYNYIDAKAAATAEIVYKVIKLLNVKINKDIAECLYIGILTDTGKFQYSNTRSDTFRMAANLIDNGVSTAELFKLVYQNNTKEKIKLMGEAIGGIELYSNDKISCIVLKKEQYSRIGAIDEDTEGIIDYARDIRSVKLALLFRESSDDKVKVSFRSKDKIDVNIFASKFGGGGHKNAAGATISGNIDIIKKQILKEAIAFLKDNN